MSAAAVGQGVGSDARAAFDAAISEVERGLDGPADLAVAFVGSAYAGAAGALATALAGLARVSVGVTAEAVVAGGCELERPDAVSVWAATLPGADLSPLRYPPPDDGDAPEPPAWPAFPPGAAGVIAFSDPFSFPAGAFLSWAGQQAPGVPVGGGYASGAQHPGGSRLLLDGEVLEDGAVAVALGGSVRLRHYVSQGCRPVGPAYVVTAADRNLVSELAGRPARERVQELYSSADAHDQALLRSGLHVGIVLDEYAEDPGTGDFIVRGVLGTHAATGALAIGEVVEVGQTVRFHVRDAASADADLADVLSGVRGEGALGALLFTCNGRGRRLFEGSDHDAGLVTAALGAAPVAGFFAAGEFGPVGGRSWVHGFTASLVVIELDAPSPGGDGGERSIPTMPDGPNMP